MFLCIHAVRKGYKIPTSKIETETERDRHRERQRQTERERETERVTDRVKKILWPS